MQNTEMVFVAFDAQDVIATSGVSFASAALMLTQDVSLSEYVDSNRYSPTSIIDSDHNNIQVFLKLYGDTGYSWYIFDSVSDYKYLDSPIVVADLYGINVIGQNTQPQGTAMDLDGILKWLHNNTNYESQ